MLSTRGPNSRMRQSLRVVILRRRESAATMGAFMRPLCSMLGLLLLPAALGAADLRPVIMREAGRCAAAWERSDCEKILAYLPPQVIQQSGGRAAMLREI